MNRWPNHLLLWIEATRPHLWPLVEAIVYEGRSKRWVIRNFGRAKWRELAEAVKEYLRRNPCY